ncbi:MAG: VanZ family protein [Bacilli bacterium]|nr:VanZ family protein [Bacilli bacterium]
MKYKNLLIELVIIGIITIIFASIPFISKMLYTFLPNVNRYLYLFVLFSFILLMGKNLINYQRTNFIGLIITYLVLIVLTLFFREKYLEYQYIGKFYLVDWFKNIFNNKVVFINIVGNLVLFMPLGFILNKISKYKLINIISGLLIIIVLEILQFITKRGVLDLVDILLNSIGLIISILVISRKEKKYE